MLVKKYFSHLSQDDIDFYTLRLQLYSLIPSEQDGAKLKIFPDKPYSPSLSWTLDYSNVLEGIVVVDESAIEFDPRESLKWNYENRVLKFLQSTARGDKCLDKIQ